MDLIGSLIAQYDMVAPTRFFFKESRSLFATTVLLLIG
jgi:hypothetical protein